MGGIAVTHRDWKALASIERAPIKDGQAVHFVKGIGSVTMCRFAEDGRLDPRTMPVVALACPSDPAGGIHKAWTQDLAGVTCKHCLRSVAYREAVIRHHQDIVRGLEAELLAAEANWGIYAEVYAEWLGALETLNEARRDTGIFRAV